jgi:hypothetical protein
MMQDKIDKGLDTSFLGEAETYNFGKLVRMGTSKKEIQDLSVSFI